MSTILEHSLDEIKRYKQRSYCPVTQMQKLNRKLAAIAAETNPEARAYLVNGYEQALGIYHVNGRAGSLLPQIKERKIINLANDLYEAYARLTPTGFIADANQADAASQRQAAAAALWMVAQ